MIIDCLFYLMNVSIFFYYKAAVFLFFIFLYIYYLKFYNTIYKKQKLIFVFILIIYAVYLSMIALDDYIVNLLYESDKTGHLIFEYKKYFYKIGFFFILFSVNYLYIHKKKFENYLLILPIGLHNLLFNQTQNTIFLFFIFIIFFVLNYKKFIYFIKDNYKYITFVIISLYLYCFVNVVIMEQFIVYLLIFLNVIVILVSRNFKITKLINLLLLETVFLFPFNVVDIIDNIGIIIYILLAYKIFKKGEQYIKKLLFHPIFISFIGIVILLVVSFYLHFNSFEFSKHNTFLFTTYMSPIEAYLKFIVYIILFLGAFILEYKRVIYNKLISVFILSIFISEIFSYSIIFDFTSILDFFHITSYSRCDPTPFTNHILYSTFLAISLIIIIDLFLKTKSIYRYLLLLFIFTAFLNLFLNGGRTGQLGFIIALSFYFWHYLKNYKKFIYFISSLFIAIFIVFNINTSCRNNQRLLKGGHSFQKVISNNYYISSWGVRLAMDLTTLNYMIEHPKKLLLGVGGGYDKEIIYNYTKSSNSNFYEALEHYDLSHTHNTFIQLLLDGGIFALLLFVYIFYYLIKIKVNNEGLKYAIVSIMFIYANQGVLLFYSTQLLLFLFVIMLILGDKKNYNESKNVEYKY